MKAGIYTRTGDNGTTGLSNKTRVSKCDSRIYAMGSVDELNSIVGMSLSFGCWEISEKKFFQDIQDDLFVIGAELSLVEADKVHLESERIALLEEKIDEVSADLTPLNNFILPGGSIRSSWFHMARAVCRRAERDVCSLSQYAEVKPDIIVYLNRLSDLMFVFSRRANQNGMSDVLWRPSK